MLVEAVYRAGSARHTTKPVSMLVPVTFAIRPFLKASCVSISVNVCPEATEPFSTEEVLCEAVWARGSSAID